MRFPLQCKCAGLRQRAHSRLSAPGRFTIKGPNITSTTQHCNKAEYETKYGAVSAHEGSGSDEVARLLVIAGLVCVGQPPQFLFNAFSKHEEEEDWKTVPVVDGSH